MEYRFLGASGFKVPVLGFGAGTFGGKGPLFSAWGNTEVARPSGWSTSASMPASTSSIRPTCIQTARQKSSSAPRSRDGATTYKTANFAPPVDEQRLYRVIDALDEIAAETGKTIPQIALSWLLQRPTVSTVLIGARNEEQLRQNLGAVGWSFSAEQLAKLDAASAVTPPYDPGGHIIKIRTYESDRNYPSLTTNNGHL